MKTVLVYRISPERVTIIKADMGQILVSEEMLLQDMPQAADGVHSPLSLLVGISLMKDFLNHSGKLFHLPNCVSVMVSLVVIQVVTMHSIVS